MMRLFLNIPLDMHDNFHLRLGMRVRGDSCDADLVKVTPTNIEVFADFLIGAARDETELEVFVVDRDGIGIEAVVLFPDEIEFCADFEVLESLTAIPVGESCDVEIGEISLHLLSVFLFHIT